MLADSAIKRSFKLIGFIFLGTLALKILTIILYLKILDNKWKGLRFVEALERLVSKTTNSFFDSNIFPKIVSENQNSYLVFVQYLI